MTTIKYAVLKHHMNKNGNRVNTILAIREDRYATFNIQCYEFQIPEFVRYKLSLKKEDKLQLLTLSKFQEL